MALLTILLHHFPSMDSNLWWLWPKITRGEDLDLPLDGYDIAFIDRGLALYVIAATHFFHVHFSTFVYQCKGIRAKNGASHPWVRRKCVEILHHPLKRNRFELIELGIIFQILDAHCVGARRRDRERRQQDRDHYRIAQERPKLSKRRGLNFTLRTSHLQPSCIYRIGSCTVTSFVPSGKVPST